MSRSSVGVGACSTVGATASWGSAQVTDQRPAPRSSTGRSARSAGSSVPSRRSTRSSARRRPRPGAPRRRRRHDDLREPGQGEQQRVADVRELARTASSAASSRSSTSARSACRGHLDARREREAQHREPVAAPRDLGGGFRAVRHDVVERGARAVEARRRRLPRRCARGPRPSGPPRSRPRSAPPCAGRPLLGPWPRPASRRATRRPPRRAARPCWPRGHPAPVGVGRRVQAQPEPRG